MQNNAAGAAIARASIYNVDFRVNLFYKNPEVMVSASLGNLADLQMLIIDIDEN